MVEGVGVVEVDDDDDDDYGGSLGVWGLLERRGSTGSQGQGVPRGAGAGTVAAPSRRKLSKKQPYWYFTASSCT